MRARIRSVLLSAPLVLFSATAAVLADESVRALGTVKDLAEDGSGFVLKGKKSVRVEVGPKTEVFRFETKITFAKLEDGTAVHVLGRKMREVRDPENNMQLVAPDRIEVVLAIVTGEFSPPPLPRDLAEKKNVEWLQGTIEKRGSECSIGDHVIFTKQGQPIIHVEKIPAAELKDRKPVEVRGVRTGKGKDAVIRATRVTSLEGKMAPSDLPFLLGAD